jgi:hypothetical protein
MPRRFLRASLYLLLTITSLGAGTLLQPANAYAAPRAATVKARVTPSLTWSIASALVCLDYCCGEILDMGSISSFGLETAWVDIRVTCRDGTVCNTSISADCAGGQCFVSFSQSGDC